MKYEAQESVGCTDSKGNSFLIVEGEVVTLAFEALHLAYFRYLGESYRMGSKEFHDNFKKVPKRINQ